MLLVFTFTILCVWLSEGDRGGEEIPCPKVQTSGHGLLNAFRVEDENLHHKEKCLGELRLLDPVTSDTWCLSVSRSGGRTETLECADSGGNIDSDTTTSTTTTTTRTTTTTDLKNN